MSIKEIMQLDIIKNNVNSLYGSIDYIEDYGYVGLYDDNISEENMKEKTLEINNLLKKAHAILEEVEDIIRDQFEY